MCLLPILVVLTILFNNNSDYWQCGRTFGDFCLSNFSASDENIGAQTEIGICYVIFNGAMLWFLFELRKLETTHDQTISTTQFEKELLIAGDVWASSNDHEAEVEKAEPTTTSEIVKNMLPSLICYLVVLLLTILYCIIENLPDHNVLNLNSTALRDLVKYATQFGIVCVNIYGVPKLVDACKFVICLGIQDKYQVYINSLLRSILAVIIPFIVSLMMLQDCGKYWTGLWDKCGNKNDLSVSFENVRYDVEDITLMRYNQICPVNSIWYSSESDSKCMRSFWDFWIPVMVVKFISLIVNPWAMLVVQHWNIDIMVKEHLTACKIARISICCAGGCESEADDSNVDSKSEKLLELKPTEKENSDRDDVNDNDRKHMDQTDKDGRKVEINSEYAMIATKLELVIIFSLISPFIIGFVVLALLSNYCCYYVMVYRLKWQIIHAEANIPIWMLYVTFIFQYLIIVGFVVKEFALSAVLVFAIGSGIVIVAFPVIVLLFKRKYNQ